jgi:O-antigen/teichoic acid export membrane protein
MSAITNARWVAIIQVARVGVQLASLFLLSRMLAPRDFGLIAMASIVTNFAMLLRDLGTASAIIQKHELDERTIATAFWLSSGVGTALGLIVVIAAPIVAALMHSPPVAGLLLALAIAFPIAGTATVQQALLEREGRFALIARIEITSALVGFGGALISAWLGAGAYSLVMQTLTIACLSTLQFWFAAPWRPRWLWGRAELAQLWKFGGSLSGFNLVNYFGRNADSMIIGRVLGAIALGPYALAYRIMLFPLYNLTFVANRALFPVMSRRQTDRAEISRLYLRTLAVIAFFTAPLMLGLWVVREPFVQIFLGPKWAEVAILIGWLAPVGLIQSLTSPSGSVLMALGRTDLQFKLGIVGTLLYVSAFLVGVRHGTEGVAQWYLAANIVNAVISTTVVLRLLDARPRVLLLVMRPVAIAAVMAVAVSIGAIWLKPLGWPATAQLLTLCAAGAALYFLLAHLGARVIERDVRKMFVLSATSASP